MLILTSNGLTSQHLLDRATPHLSGKRCALVTTASLGFKQNDKNVPRHAKALQTCGASQIALFDFDEQPPEALAAYEAALLIGGNPYYLLLSIRRNGFTQPLRRLAEKGTLIGVSAGALVLTPSIAVIDVFTPEINEAVGLTDKTGLSLCDCEILPHYSKFVTRFDLFEERAQEYEQQNNVTLHRLSDGEALFFGA
ncbi:MAG: Type 1 glutamine amidotransferase-like domain-containing protein [Candidatus Spyradocola sp.]